MFCALLLLLAIGLVSCVGGIETPVSQQGGFLQLSLDNILTSVTRSTPSELGTPTTDDFRLTVISSKGFKAYDGAFTEKRLRIPVGEYDITISYGDNATLAIDEPYYVGTTTATVLEDETTEVAMNCKVGNALISAIFGTDEEERARFERFYSDYALYVCVGNYSMPITKEKPSQSVYVQSGSHVSLRFWGKLKMADNREVSCELTSDDFPETLNAADHAVVTLSLPDPESALVAEISKVDIETVTLDETIPLSWLPVAQVIPMHQFDKNGLLVGTNLIITESYPGKKWRAVITNAAGTIVRAVEGTGALLSEYNADANKNTWPYLPQGNYKASYYFFEDDGTATPVSYRDFTVDAPQNLKVTVTGYTSYSMYQAGDIDGANACDRLTIYEPSVSVNVATSLLTNSNYNYSFTYSYDGTTASVAAGNNRYAFDKFENQPVRQAPHVLKGTIIFDGVQVEGQKEFLITGLPATYAPPSVETGWSSEGSDYVTFDSSYVLLGKAGGVTITHNEFINITDFYIPIGTRMKMGYNIMIHPATEGTSFFVNCGNQTILSIDQNGGLGNSEDYPHKGTSEVLTATTNIASINCINLYGGGQTCTYIYSLHFEYSE